MSLHHIVTIYSHLGMFFIGNHRSIVLIDICHDWTDITFSIMKAMHGTIFDPFAQVVFVINIIFWFYFRLLVFPYIVYQTWAGNYLKFDRHQNFINYFFVYQQSCLIFLNFYWFSIMIKIIMNIIFKDSNEENRHQKK